MRTLSRLSLASFSFALAAVACGAPAGDDSSMNTQPIGVGGVVDVDATVDLEICGSVDLYVAASANVDGMLKLSGKHYWIKAGAHVDAEAKLAVHADVCIKAKVDVDGKLVAIVVLDKGATTGSGGSSGSSGGGSSGGGSSGGSCDDKGHCWGGGSSGPSGGPCACESAWSCPFESSRRMRVRVRRAASASSGPRSARRSPAVSAESTCRKISAWFTMSCSRLVRISRS